MTGNYSPQETGGRIVVPEFIAQTEIYDVDAIVIGAGILGLMVAKHLVDVGQTVALVEQSETIADGSSIKNHGWLHTGIAHSLSVRSPLQARVLVKKLQHGHRFFTSYAPECFDEPLDPTYAVARDPELADRARTDWVRFDIPHRELGPDEFFEIEPGLNPEKASYFFENTDARINNRLLFAKLMTDIRRGGALALKGASYEYDDSQTIQVTNTAGRHKLRSQLFFYTTGAGLDESYEKLTGGSLGMRYWKSHLLVMPRITNASIVSLDHGTPIVINHGNASIVNRSYDEVLLSDRDSGVDSAEVARAFDVLCEYYPRAADHTEGMHAVACLKPDIPDSTTAVRHNIGESIYEPRPGHIFALPGKMTEAPYVAASLVRGASERLNLRLISKRPLDLVQENAGALAWVDYQRSASASSSANGRRYCPEPSASQ